MPGLGSPCGVATLRFLSIAENRGCGPMERMGTPKNRVPSPVRCAGRRGLGSSRFIGSRQAPGINGR